MPEKKGGFVSSFMDSFKKRNGAGEFRELTVDDLQSFAKFYDLRPNLTADSVPLESFLWKNYYNARAAVVFRGEEEIGLLWLYELCGEPFGAMPLCRPEDLPFCFGEIRKYFNEVLGKPLLIKLADDGAMEILGLDPEEYLIREEEDMKDYLYDGEAMRTLAGRKLHKKKNHYNSFVKIFGERWLYRPLTREDRGDVYRCLEAWRENKGEEVERHMDPEVEGIHDLLNHLDQLEVKMGGVFIDGKMQAFTMGSLNRAENMAVIHIEKANPEIEGLYQVINREFLLNEFPEVTLVNREDDLGLPGLRQSKLSYNPCGYARKFLVYQTNFGGETPGEPSECV